MCFNQLPIGISNGDLEYTLGKINGNGSSIHFGLLSLKTDTHPHEHRLRQFGAEKMGESIPSIDLAPFGRWTLRDKAAQRVRLGRSLIYAPA
jgi:hypothetical protein